MRLRSRPLPSRRGGLGRGVRGLLLLLALGGCAAVELASTFASRQPPRLFQLGAPEELPADLPASDASLAIEVPTASAGLNTARIVLHPTHTTLDYFADAAWVDVVPVMVQGLLIATIEQTGEVEVLGRDAVGVRGDYALLTEIRDFQAEYEGRRGPPRVRVRVSARLVSLPRRTSVAATSAERLLPAADTTLEAVVAAFDQGMREVLAELGAWTLRELARAG